jgi:hypothetical protein
MPRVFPQTLVAEPVDQRLKPQYSSLAWAKAEGQGHRWGLLPRGHIHIHKLRYVDVR